MNNTNIVVGIVKILEKPKQEIVNKNNAITKFRVHFPQFRKTSTSVVHLTFWGNLAREALNCYKNDYILIDGYISLRPKKISQAVTSKSKKVEITVLKFHSFFPSN